MISDEHYIKPFKSEEPYPCIYKRALLLLDEYSQEMILEHAVTTQAELGAQFFAAGDSGRNMSISNISNCI